MNFFHLQGPLLPTPTPPHSPPTPVLKTGVSNLLTSTQSLHQLLGLLDPQVHPPTSMAPAQRPVPPPAPIVAAMPPPPIPQAVFPPPIQQQNPLLLLESPPGPQSYIFSPRGMPMMPPPSMVPIYLPSIQTPGTNGYQTPPHQNKRKIGHIPPSPEPSPEGGYIGQHSQGIGGHYQESYITKKMRRF